MALSALALKLKIKAANKKQWIIISNSEDHESEASDELLLSEQDITVSIDPSKMEQVVDILASKLDEENAPKLKVAIAGAEKAKNVAGNQLVISPVIGAVISQEFLTDLETTLNEKSIGLDANAEEAKRFGGAINLGEPAADNQLPEDRSGASVAVRPLQPNPVPVPQAFSAMAQAASGLPNSAENSFPATMPPIPVPFAQSPNRYPLFTLPSVANNSGNSAVPSTGTSHSLVIQPATNGSVPASTAGLLAPNNLAMVSTLMQNNGWIGNHENDGSGAFYEISVPVPPTAATKEVRIYQDRITATSAAIKEAAQVVKQLPTTIGGEIASLNNSFEDVVKMAEAMIAQGMIFTIATTPATAATINMQTIKAALNPQMTQQLQANLNALGDAVPEEIKAQLVTEPSQQSDQTFQF